LDLRGCDRIGTAGLERLAEFQRLVAVRLGGYPVNDGVLRTLAGIKSLRSITLDEGGVTDEGLTALGDLDLEEVSLARCLNLTDGGFAVFERIENLKSASFRDLAITDAALAYLGSRRRLETLVLRELLITDAGLNHLKGLAALRHLSLRQIAISDTGTAALGGMTRLETLDLAGNRLTAAALPALANLVRLKTLDLSDNPEIADAAVEPLGRMRQLRSLRLWQTGFSPEGLNWLRQRLADCEIVYDRPL
jgi:Ran GTPase-activating protein (RanGAP) involved in mRNA processing and transport